MRSRRAASDGELVVGTFIPPVSAHNSTSPDGSLQTGKISAAAQARLMELLAGLPNVRFIHDLDIRASYIRDDQIICGDRYLNDLDVYVWFAEVDRSVGSYALEALRTLSLDITVVPEPARFEIGLDKHRSHLQLRRAGVSVPETILVERRRLDLAQDVLARWGSAVLKPRRGSFGHGVLLIDDFATLRDVVGYSTSVAGDNADGGYLLERYYPNDPDDWVGTTLINGELMYGYRKRPTQRVTMKPGSWKVYDPVRRGGHVDLCEVPPAYLEQARRAQRILGLPVVGFDLIRFGDTPIIVDENTYPGLYDYLFEETGKDLGRELCTLITNTIAAHRSHAVSSTAL